MQVTVSFTCSMSSRVDSHTISLFSTYYNCDLRSRISFYLSASNLLSNHPLPRRVVSSATRNILTRHGTLGDERLGLNPSNTMRVLINSAR